MAKSLFFSHDFDARSDPKIVAMRYEFGVQGYGAYWMVVEMMAESTGYKLPFNKNTCRALAVETGWDMESAEYFLRQCTEEYLLFVIEDGFIFSDSLLARMKHKDAVSQKRKEAGQREFGDPWKLAFIR